MDNNNYPKGWWANRKTWTETPTKSKKQNHKQNKQTNKQTTTTTTTKCTQSDIHPLLTFQLTLKHCHQTLWESRHSNPETTRPMCMCNGLTSAKKKKRKKKKKRACWSIVMVVISSSRDHQIWSWVFWTVVPMLHRLWRSYSEAQVGYHPTATPFFLYRPPCCYHCVWPLRERKTLSNYIPIWQSFKRKLKACSLRTIVSVCLPHVPAGLLSL